MNFRFISAAYLKIVYSLVFKPLLRHAHICDEAKTAHIPWRLDGLHLSFTLQWSLYLQLSHFQHTGGNISPPSSAALNPFSVLSTSP